MEKTNRVEIDLAKFKNNIKNLKSLIKNDTKFLAVVKANAYGHGLVSCAKAACEAGADFLGVVSLNEAIKLRDSDILKPILVLGEIHLKDMRLAANKEISVPIVSLKHAKEIAEIPYDKPLKVHLKVDTGLNRLGLEISEILEAYQALKTNQNIKFEGIYSHLASVEENELEYAKMQLDNFNKAISVLGEKARGMIRHIASTAATLVLPQSHYDMVRCGIGVYGLWPSEEIKTTFKKFNFLEPVMQVKTKLVQIKKVQKGEKIGYGCAFESPKEIIVGVIPFGYGEGLDRHLTNSGQVLVNGRRVPIIGRICMNMTIIDLSECGECQLYDEVVILGRQGNETITAEEIAQKVGTINYEIVTRISPELTRIYLS